MLWQYLHDKWKTKCLTDFDLLLTLDHSGDYREACLCVWMVMCTLNWEPANWIEINVVYCHWSRQTKRGLLNLLSVVAAGVYSTSALPGGSGLLIAFSNCRLWLLKYYSKVNSSRSLWKCILRIYHGLPVTLTSYDFFYYQIANKKIALQMYSIDSRNIFKRVPNQHAQNMQIIFKNSFLSSIISSN